MSEDIQLDDNNRHGFKNETWYIKLEEYIKKYPSAKFLKKALINYSLLRPDSSFNHFKFIEDGVEKTIFIYRIVPSNDSFRTYNDILVCNSRKKIEDELVVNQGSSFYNLFITKNELNHYLEYLSVCQSAIEMHEERWNSVRKEEKEEMQRKETARIQESERIDKALRQEWENIPKPKGKTADAYYFIKEGIGKQKEYFFNNGMEWFYNSYSYKYSTDTYPISFSFLSMGDGDIIAQIDFRDVNYNKVHEYFNELLDVVKIDVYSLWKATKEYPTLIEYMTDDYGIYTEFKYNDYINGRVDVVIRLLKNSEIMYISGVKHNVYTVFISFTKITLP
jgi:hypothetical protein